MYRFALLWIVLAASCGVVLFHTSQRVTDGRQDVAALEGKIAEEAESARVLAAEWAWLNRPARLERLAHKYLGLTPLQGRQFAAVSVLDAPPEEKKPVPPAPAPKQRLAPAAEAVPLAEAPPMPAPPQPQDRALARATPPRAPGSSPAPGRNFGDLMRSLGTGR